jgi:membrane protein implicated in regulation of membrane protease activity
MKFADESDLAEGVGADRLVGMTAIVTTTIDPDDTERRGRVKVEGEVWSALTNDGIAITDGSKVTVTEVHGTRVIVTPLIAAPPTATPTGPPLQKPPPPNQSTNREQS